MKRLGILVLVLAGLAALFGSCGGGDGEETGVLAVAFRLDGESPLLTAYFGDPTEDPLQLPAGRYYIEALDQDDVAISLGAVDIEEGDVVDFPPSFDDAGGSADAQRVESLKTVASFLIDVELSELVFLEAVTGGFTLTPFDPAVEPDAASVQELLGLYTEMAAQEEALEAALSEIDGRAEVSLGASYVRSPWAPAPDLTDVLKKSLDDWKKSTFSFFHNATVVRQRKRILEIADKISKDKQEEVFSKLSSDKQGDAANFDNWLEKVRTDDDFVRTQGSGIYYELDGLDHGAVVDSGNSAINVLAEEGPKGANYAKDKVLEAYKHVTFVGKIADVTEKALEWEEYAKKLAKDLGETLEESARGRVQKALEDKVKSNLKERFPKLSDKAIDGLAQYFAKKAVDALPKPPSPLTPAAAPTATQAVPTPKATPKVTPSASPAAPTPQVTPDITPSASPTPEESPAPDTGWIEGYVQGIASGWLDKGYEGIDVAVAADDLRACLTDRVVNLGFSQDGAKAECPAWLFEPSLPEETPSPSPTPSPTPSPLPSPSPSPEPTPSPTIEARQVTAVGQYVGETAEPQSIVRNTMTLTFNTGGGPGSAEGRGELDQLFDMSCGLTHTYWVMDYQGTYSPDSNTFDGTWQWHKEDEYYTGYGPTCELHTRSDGNSGTWQATLEGGVVRGHPVSGAGPTQWNFELTVQG